MNPVFKNSFISLISSSSTFFAESSNDRQVSAIKCISLSPARVPLLKGYYCEQFGGYYYRLKNCEYKLHVLVPHPLQSFPPENGIILSVMFLRLLFSTRFPCPPSPVYPAYRSISVNIHWSSSLTAV